MGVPTPLKTQMTTSGVKIGLENAWRTPEKEDVSQL